MSAPWFSSPSSGYWLRPGIPPWPFPPPATLCCRGDAVRCCSQRGEHPMSSGSRIVVTLGLFLGLVAAGNRLRPAWLARLGLDWTTLADLHRQREEIQA